MNSLYRVIDANINRSSEGLRVLEDYSRFILDSESITKKLREIRHLVRKEIKKTDINFLSYRDSENDTGLKISLNTKLDNKIKDDELIEGNFKRVQEGIRTVEENLKTAGHYKISKEYEKIRFSMYTIEKSFNTVLNKKSKLDKLNTDIYCITAEKYSNGKSNIEVVKELIDSDIKIIQYREKEKSQKEKLLECEKIRELTKENDVLFIVNDDVDIAILAKADGIHIGQDDLPIEKVRELIGNDMIIGKSTHSKNQAIAAINEKADYIGVGPLFKTFTKVNVCEPVGLSYLDYIVKIHNIPFVAIGGIKNHNILDVRRKGAKLIALVTEIVGAENINKKILELRKILKEI